MLLVVHDCWSLFKFVPAICRAQNLKPLLVVCSSVLDTMTSTFSSGAAVRFWTPNLGPRVPVDLTTGLPDYSEYVNSGLWVNRRRLRACGGTGETAYIPEGDRAWPKNFPVPNLKIYPTSCPMRGVTQEKPQNPVAMLQILEGQISLVHHIMAYEEANPSVHVLYPRQKWKASFLAYFLGAVNKSQLVVMEQLGDESHRLTAPAGKSGQANAYPIACDTTRASSLACTIMPSLRTSTQHCKLSGGRLTKSWLSFLCMCKSDSLSTTTSQALTGTFP